MKIIKFKFSFAVNREFIELYMTTKTKQDVDVLSKIEERVVWL